MTDAVDPPKKIDQAALLGAALAAAVGISAAEGPWEPIESVIGFVLLLIVRAFYDISAARSRPDWHLVKYAVSGVLALIWCLIVAFFVQLGLTTTSWAGKLPLVLTVITASVFVWQVIALTRDRPSRGAKVQQFDTWLGAKVRQFDAWLGKRSRSAKNPGSTIESEPEPGDGAGRSGEHPAAGV